MSKYPKAKMPDYGDGPEPCEDCAIKDKRITELKAERRRAMVHLEEMKRLYEESTDVDNLVAALTEACQIRLIFKSEGDADD